ncbi:MAG: response regulator [Pirellulales bacterium]|nr:response regulator [Pirellulales bacterium]
MMGLIPRYFRQHLAVRLIAVAFVFLTIVTAAVGWYAAWTARGVLQQQADALGASLARASSITCIEPLLVADYPVLETYAETLVEDGHDVSFVRILRHDGTVVAEAPRGGSRDPELLSQCRVHRCKVTPSPEDPTVLGSVTIGITTRESDAQVARYTRRLAIGVVLAFAALIVLFALTVRYVVGRPLEQLEALAVTAGKGNWESEIRLDRSDELGRLAETLNEMRRNLKDSHRAILEQNEHLKIADRLKDEFLANMSHEIRTPMTAILGYAELLYTEGDVSQAPPERIQALETILRNGQRLLALLNDILDFSKIESGEMAVERIACSPSEIVDEAADSVRPGAEAKGLVLEVVHDGPIPKLIQTDPARLRQILTNLVSNAVKFTPHGSIRLETRLRPIGHGKADIEFQVVDTGIGLTEAQIDTLFEPFTQVDSSSTRRFGGAGLGLAITKRLCTLLGGTLSVSSRKGEGSVFSVRIPAGSLDELQLSGDPSSSLQGPSVEPKLPTATLAGRVLLAEDGPDNQRLLSWILRKAGAEVTVAENGAVAVEQAHGAMKAGRPFDIILMDMQMPVLDGYEATKALRAAGYFGPIVALTAHAMEGDRRKCLEAGCDDYLTKPIDRNRFVAAVANHLDIEATEASS